MAFTKLVLHYSFEAWVQNLQMIQNGCLKMIGKYPRTKTVDFLLSDFSVLKVGEYLQLPVTYA
jgi:hypothetical protein